MKTGDVRASKLEHYTVGIWINKQQRRLPSKATAQLLLALLVKEHAWARECCKRSCPSLSAMSNQRGGRAPTKLAKYTKGDVRASHLTAVFDACKRDMLDGRLLDRQRFAHHHQSGRPLREDLRANINHQRLCTLQQRVQLAILLEPRE